MFPKRFDYSNLLDNLRDISNHYYINGDGDVINKAGELQNDEDIITKTKFYILYCMGYKTIDKINEKNSQTGFDRDFINRALASYGMFNYFINTCLGEYRIYDDIGTGNVIYVPYQPLADFFFENETRKEVLFDYLKKEFTDIFENDNSKKRVK